MRRLIWGAVLVACVFSARAELSSEDRMLRSQAIERARSGTYSQAQAKALLARAYEYMTRRDHAAADQLYLAGVDHLAALAGRGEGDTSLLALGYLYSAVNRQALLLDNDDYYVSQMPAGWRDFVYLRTAWDLAQSVSGGGLAGAEAAQARKSCAWFVQRFTSRGRRFPAPELQSTRDAEDWLVFARKVCLESASPAPPLQSASWRMQGAYASSFTLFTGLSRRLAESLQSASAGQIQVTAVPTGAIAPAFGLLEAVGSARTLELAWVPPGFFTQKNAAFSLLGGAPFGGDAASYVSWRDQPQTVAVADRLYAAHGVKGLNCGAMNSQILWTRKPIRSGSDLRGLKMSSPVALRAMLKAAGVVVQALPAIEIYPALDRGYIDAAIGPGPVMDELLKLNEAARYAYRTALAGHATGLDLLMNKAMWDSLGAERQQGIVRACKAMQLKVISETDGAAALSLEKFRAGGVTVAPLPPEVTVMLRESWKRASAEDAGSPEYAALLRTLPSLK